MACWQHPAQEGSLHRSIPSPNPPAATGIMCEEDGTPYQRLKEHCDIHASPEIEMLKRLGTVFLFFILVSSGLPCDVTVIILTNTLKF